MRDLIEHERVVRKVREKERYVRVFLVIEIGE
jgi:hypothetical protein